MSPVYPSSDASDVQDTEDLNPLESLKVRKGRTNPVSSDAVLIHSLNPERVEVAERYALKSTRRSRAEEEEHEENEDKGKSESEAAAARLVVDNVLVSHEAAKASDRTNAASSRSQRSPPDAKSRDNVSGTPSEYEEDGEALPGLSELQNQLEPEATNDRTRSAHDTSSIGAVEGLMRNDGKSLVTYEMEAAGVRLEPKIWTSPNFDANQIPPGPRWVPAQTRSRRDQRWPGPWGKKESSRSPERDT
ncbi:hypothetical protein LTR10_016159 [Elasticomyces elasticus]|uniref:Uncharacterized protein n=1 Tax=Exophiala sideris TaxID=1016849 RepID=A0ABR0JEI9_9EURO|nr:hypothetical protein LTR10_016159 [Elasticomyces elasticus]KAK5027605.1 hypothetical protein LTR13_009538 [Exophiala sideris]KAK5032832.1 hypothetical protein LTS07_004242 [Exophiala sideris]KAK5062356.1 hypothetical protein LTR69_004714 [Exophiala sideris]KAK5177514.1 hypothetical protein LTR44_009924 [Eurotiomycetes sp. CCFEE 6388]